MTTEITLKIVVFDYYVRRRLTLSPRTPTNACIKLLLP